MFAVNHHLKRIGKIGQRVLGGFAIGAAVGDWANGATNNPEDVETVQLLLEDAARQQGVKAFDPQSIDGQISRAVGKSSTVKAVRAYQRTFMRKPDGVVDPDGNTLKRLQSEASGDSEKAQAANRSVMQAANSTDGLPSWLTQVLGASTQGLLPGFQPAAPAWISVAEEELGQTEIDGKKHNKRIIEYHSTTGSKKTDENPWCASFVNWVVEKAGYEGTKSAWSHSWRNWGDGISSPAVGSIAFIDWGRIYADRKGKGHVGFVVGKSARGRIVLLGGNQSGKVRYTGFKKRQIVGYRVPKGYQVHTSLYDLPILKVQKGGGGFRDTR